jgi:predicted dehydrogenase
LKHSTAARCDVSIANFIIGSSLVLIRTAPNEGYFDGPYVWRSQPGGGVVLINLIHVVDDLRNICGDVISVQAAESNAARGFLVEDTAAMILRFASGALGTLIISDAAASPWSWELTSGENKAYPHTDQFCYLVAGTKGSLTVPRLDVWSHEGDGWWTPIQSARSIEPEQDPLTLQMRHFCAVNRAVVRAASAASKAADFLLAFLPPVIDSVVEDNEEAA